MTNLLFEQPRLAGAIRRATWHLAAARVELASKRLMHLRRKAGFNSDQPRVPAGSSGGGQWTSTGGGGGTGGGPASRDDVEESPSFDDVAESPSFRVVEDTESDDGSISRQTAISDDGTAIRSEYATPDSGFDWDSRHAVRLPDGSITVFENSGSTQTIYDGDGNPISGTAWPASDPDAEATVQPVFFDPRRFAVQKAIEAGLALYGWLLGRDSADKTVAVELQADDVDSAGGLTGLPKYKELTHDETENNCPRLTEVQGLADSAAGEFIRSDYARAADYGTAVHTRLRDKIRALDDPNLKAEVSLQKTFEETGLKPRDALVYGASDSIRIDVLERTDSGAVCVYDLKTGKSGLRPARFEEIARTARKHYPKTTKIVIIQMRPTR